MAPETKTNADASKGERIAKFMARAGVCSRREAEALIVAGKVKVDGKKILSPALNILPNQQVMLDGKPISAGEKTRLWLYHKPSGLVTTHKDPEGRPTVFAALPKTLPRVISIGRLDLTSEGLLLLTNDGALARHLEHPSTGWVRRYRVRVWGAVTPAMLAAMRKGITVQGVSYGSVKAELERSQGDNHWLAVSLAEGKNREIRRIFEHFGCKVNRLIRVSYGPFQLGALGQGEVKEITGKVLREAVGEKMVQRS